MRDKNRLTPRLRIPARSLRDKPSQSHVSPYTLKKITIRRSFLPQVKKIRPCIHQRSLRRKFPNRSYGDRRGKPTWRPKMQTGTAGDQVGAEMSDRIEAPLTTERRYGFSRIGCAIAVIMIVVAVGVGVALLTGIRDAGILLAILLPVVVLTAVLANLFLWWQHKKAVRNRELATSDQSRPMSQVPQASASPQTPRSSVSWFRRFSQRGSTRSTPPPGYQSVFGGS